MRLTCHLRTIRGRRSLRDLADTAGINRGQLSLLELGRMLPKDEWVPALEAAYGAPVAEWYDQAGLLAIQADPPAEGE